MPSTSSVPPILYKYCDLRGIDILQSLRLKITPPNQFNDPFELAPRMEPALTREQATAPLRDLEILSRSYRDLTASGNFSGTFEEFVAFLQQHQDRLAGDFIASYPDDAAEFRRQHVNDVSREFGLLCLSATYDDLLMWSHYCAKHTGFVVGFDTSHEFFTSGPPLQEVQYLDERVLMGRVVRRNDPVLPQTINRLIRRKSPHWQHEREWRQLYFLPRCAPDMTTVPMSYYVPIQANAIVEVIYGCRCDKETFERALSQLRFSHVRIKAATMHDTNFSLVIN